MGVLLRDSLIALSIIILFKPLRFNLITQPAYKTLANSMPSISTTEQEALEAGTSWWEKELFMGAPDWSQFEKYPYPTLSPEEQSFIDNEVEVLCSMLDEWEIHHQLKTFLLKFGSSLKIKASWVLLFQNPLVVKSSAHLLKVAL